MYTVYCLSTETEAVTITRARPFPGQDLGLWKRGQGKEENLGEIDQDFST